MAEIKMYTLEEVASILKVTQRSMYNYLKSGKLKAVKIGRLWRVHEEELNRFINAGILPTTASPEEKAN